MILKILSVFHDDPATRGSSLVVRFRCSVRLELLPPRVDVEGDVLAGQGGVVGVFWEGGGDIALRLAFSDQRKRLAS